MNKNQFSFLVGRVLDKLLPATVSSMPTICSLAHSYGQIETVSIEDSKGLEHLLGRTEIDEELEWGTLFELTHQGKNVDIYSIMDSYLAEKKGFVTERKEDGVLIDILKRRSIGDHHYHPPKGAGNFTINGRDKYTEILKPISLLTFNMDYGPELIAFTWKNVYIPEDKKAPKDKLYKANWKQIYRYLK